MNSTELVLDFNRRIKMLVTKLVDRWPNDPTIQRIRKRVYAGADLSPVFVVDEVGAYLYQYSELIYRGADDFFLNKDYSAEIAASEDQEKADMISYVIPKVKEAWGVADAAEKDAYKTAVQDLLDVYMDYLEVITKK